MKSRLLLLSAFLFASPAFGQFAFLQDIEVDTEAADNKIGITVNGVKPSPCFQVDSQPLVEDHMVTIAVEVKFPEGTTRCTRQNAPFQVSSLIEPPVPGEYEVQVTINGEMQVQYRHFLVEEGETAGMTTAALETNPIQ